ncbi:MAG: transporter substrate-binding domain-containing protein [Halieaceae bacterium]|jgi:polar amino acid transport system substrate-binding protein|nr:transporter substrate-binding domain-containing protein [Halieaceae bacterium]
MRTISFSIVYLFSATRLLASSIVLLASTALPALSSDKYPVLDVLVYESLGEAHENEEGEIVGAAVDKVRQFLDKSGLEYTVKQLPWARLYKQVLGSDHTLAVNLLRTVEREDDFHWIYRIRIEEQFLIASNTTAMRAFDRSEIAEGKYTAICDRQSAQCDFLKSLGFPDKNIMRFYGMTTGEQVQMVLSGRIDFVIDGIDSLTRDIQDLNIEADELIQVMSVHRTGVYLVASKSIDPQVLNILRKVARQESGNQ